MCLVYFVLYIGIEQTEWWLVVVVVQKIGMCENNLKTSGKRKRKMCGRRMVEMRFWVEEKSVYGIVVVNSVCDSVAATNTKQKQQIRTRKTRYFMYSDV